MGLPFTIALSDIVIPKCCPVLGMSLKSRFGTGKKPGRNSPSLDRVNPQKGYVKGNVIVVSFFANQIKTNATPDQILAVGRFYKKLIG